jgi:hypothetical protein
MMGISPSPQLSPSGRGGTRREKVNVLREWWLRPKQSKPQSMGGEELSALMASILDKAFKGEL